VKEIALSEAEVQRVVRDCAGLHIGVEMSRYLLGKSWEVDQPVAIFGADARTGLPCGMAIDLRVLGKEQP
jgi:hypothetical protein